MYKVASFIEGYPRHTSSHAAGIVMSQKDLDEVISEIKDLVSNGYYVADDSEGNVIDTINSKHNLNGMNIKLTYENGVLREQAREKDRKNTYI